MAEEEAAAAQGQQNRQPKEKNEPDSSSAAASGATVDADRHDLCDEVCDDDLEKYRDARLEEMLWLTSIGYSAKISSLLLLVTFFRIPNGVTVINIDWL